MFLRVLEEDDSRSRWLQRRRPASRGRADALRRPSCRLRGDRAVEIFTRSKRRSWRRGESPSIGGVGFVTIALGLPGVVFWATPESTGSLGVLVLVGGVLLAALIGQMLTGIAKTALYLYATDEDTAECFDDIDFGAGGECRRRLDEFQNTGGVV